MTIKTLIIFLLYTFCFSSIIFSQKSENSEWHNLLTKLGPRLTNNTFLSDSILPLTKMKYEYIETFANEKDKSIIKKILRYGTGEIAETNNLIEYLSKNIKVKQLNKFDTLQDIEPILSVEEGNLLRKIKYLDSLLQKEPAGTKSYQKLKHEENKLFDSLYFKSYTKKLNDSQKRILIFFPVFKWGNKRLVVFNYFHSVTNSATFVYILQ